jgi:antitoxin component of MazEF toxin-antitoxin module
MEMVYKAKFVKVGNSVAVIIPKPLLKKLDWRVGDTVDIDLDDQKRIVITWLGREKPPLSPPSTQTSV